MSKVVWPVMGVIYTVSAGIAAMDSKYHVAFGPLTGLAWLIVWAGALAFVAWAGYHIFAAVTGRGTGA